MTHNPYIHHRRSIRFKEYDYSQAGLYFITICCQDRKHLLGHIENGEMILNNAGIMVEKWYFELENKNITLIRVNLRSSAFRQGLADNLVIVL